MPLTMPLSEEQMSDYKGAALILDALSRAKALLGDRGYDADCFRKTLAGRDIAACITSKRNRMVQIPHDAVLYGQRLKFENMFGRPKDWRRVHTSYDAARTPSSPPSAPQQPSPSGSINES
jgi:transposase